MEYISICEDTVREFWDMAAGANIVDPHKKIPISDKVFVSRKAIKHIVEQRKKEGKTILDVCSMFSHLKNTLEKPEVVMPNISSQYKNSLMYGSFIATMNRALIVVVDVDTGNAREVITLFTKNSPKFRQLVRKGKLV